MSDTTQVRLTQTVNCAGCAAKLDPTMLIDSLGKVPWPTNEQVLVGFDQCDDAGIFRESESGVDLVATTDFFTPIVDDPHTYGAAAAANALSDIYAMGGTPLFALSILHYPEDLGGDLLAEILGGVAAVCAEANCPVLGGHSVRADMMTVGLACTGRLPAGTEALTNAGARVGDSLVLTKALGTGVLATALKKGVLGEAAETALVAGLTRLNRHAGSLLHSFPVHAATDVTGFGLIGHGCEVASASDCRLVIDSGALPLLPDFAACVEAGCLTRGDKSNRRYAGDRLHVADSVSELAVQACADPQSSGGLLMALPADAAEDLVRALHDGGDTPAAIIGQVEAGPAGIHLV